MDWIENQNVIGGSTSKSIWVDLITTAGAAKADAVFSDVTATYTRPGGTTQTIAMATLAAIDSDWTSGGFKHAANGAYRFDIPDAVIATLSGGGLVLVTMAVTGCMPRNFQLSIVEKNSSRLNDLNAAGVRGAIGMAAANFDTQISGISTKTANIPSDPADASDVAAIIEALGVAIAAIKAKTDNLPGAPAAVGDIPAANIAAIKAVTDGLTGAAAALVKLLAACYDSASVDGNEITLSNGATQTITSGGRVTQS